MADKNIAELLLGTIEYNARALATAADESIPKRPQFCEGARLQFLVPVDSAREVHSWVGGKPRLPDPFIWPIIDDHPLHFLAQIDCSQLPENIWGGAGPRTGWLAFFLGFEHASKTRVIHTETLGPERTPPMPWLRKDLQLYPFNYAPVGWEFEPPMWPVEITTYREGDEDPIGKYTKTDDPDLPNPYTGEEVTLSNPLYAPHNWETLALLLDIAKLKAEEYRVSLRDNLAALHNEQEAPAFDDSIALRILGEALAQQGRLERMDKTRRFDPESWQPFAEAAAEWRTLQVVDSMQHGEPMARLCAQAMRLVDEFQRAAYETLDKRTGLKQRREALRKKIIELSLAVKDDTSLPPTAIGQSTNTAGWRLFRDEEPALWSKYAEQIEALFRSLHEFELDLRPARHPDSKDKAWGEFSHFSNPWPENRGEAAIFLEKYVSDAEALLRYRRKEKTDHQPQIDETEDQLKKAEAAESEFERLVVWAAQNRPSLPFLRLDLTNTFNLIEQPHIMRSDWADIYNRLRSEVMKRDYVSGVRDLPEHLLHHFERKWAFDAAHEVAAMGGLPHGWSYEMIDNVDTHVMLLELPTSNLMGWQWGNCYNLIFTISLEDLQRGDFSNTGGDVTN